MHQNTHALDQRIALWKRELGAAFVVAAPRAEWTVIARKPSGRMVVFFNAENGQTFSNALDGIEIINPPGGLAVGLRLFHPALGICERPALIDRKLRMHAHVGPGVMDFIAGKRDVAISGG